MNNQEFLNKKVLEEYKKYQDAKLSNDKEQIDRCYHSWIRAEEIYSAYLRDYNK